ncbi:hypothetical protein [Acidiluteibacter ferrifornacis]|uniref:Uncharacterized protein n=1 Tax=Acidiluteibacter ferrifornacis TaxID=2692424 RepID=A0A6N9NL07_9FLAO|nr:hypothetical protein [Acidiluteibacter ferrifornacis]NBG67388.1 hypothetical protein [Acidiluteibacter ferrifornacis]
MNYKLFITFFALSLIFVSCKKEDSDNQVPNKDDYRNKYEGNYLFQVNSKYYMVFDTTIYDTSFYVGTVVKHPDSLNRIIVDYGKESIPIIDESGNLTLPEIGSGNTFKVFFLDYTKININTQLGGRGKNFSEEIIGQKL